jgi:hypothetical protein
VLAWRRGDQLIAAVNVSSSEVPFDAARGGELLLSSDPGRGSRALDRLGAREAVKVRMGE